MLKQIQRSTCRELPFPAAAPFMRSMPSRPYWSYSARDCGSESTSAWEHPSQRLSLPCCIAHHRAEDNDTQALHSNGQRRS